MILNFTKLSIARRFQRKEPGAIAWIHNHYFAFVYKVVESTIGYSSEMEKLVEAVFLKLPDAAGQLDSFDKMKDFLYLKARTTCQNYMNKMELNGSEDADELDYNLGSRCQGTVGSKNPL